MPSKPAAADRCHYTLSVPVAFRETLNDVSKRTGVPATVIVQRLVMAWVDGKIKPSNLSSPK